jgi:hypothetical protein
VAQERHASFVHPCYEFCFGADGAVVLGRVNLVVLTLTVALPEEDWSRFAALFRRIR